MAWRVNENATFLVRFVRAKCTKFDSGYIYAYPDKEDMFPICKSQVLYRVPPPKKILRGAFKFSVHHNSL